ncbi:MAG: salicylate 5-hydroxylase large subunit [Acidimicrobiia bacterium]|jgi:salicylate 5-hydroxylase large subunit|nr:salicylate 5-hydroxylase large subunit [Acidimicrobiia bacterium]
MGEQIWADRPAIDLHWPAEGTTRVPYAIYSDPAVYTREQERIFAGPYWSYVGLACEAPEPGDFVRTFIGDRPVVLCRDRHGELRCYVNRCAHRGVQFCRQDSGHVTEWVCPYHQWVYDLDGTLVAVPFRRGVKGNGGMLKDFDLGVHGLQRLQVAERHGVVFASFSPETPPLEDYLGPTMVAYFDRVFAGRTLTLLGYQRQRVPGNWKLMFENIKDPYHASLLHVFLVTFGLFRADQPSSVKMDATGRHAVLCSQRGEQKTSDLTAELRSFHEDLRLHDPRLLDPVKEFEGPETVVMQTLWPNLIVQQQSNTLAMRQLVTRGPDAFDLHWTFFGYADDDEAMQLRRLRQANLMGPAGYVSIDDGEVMALGQNGVAAYPEAIGLLEMGGTGEGDENHMVTEAAIRAFYRYYREVMEL